MMEMLFAVVVFALAACGLAAGLLLGRGPAQGSCGGTECAAGPACAGCPKRLARAGR